MRNDTARTETASPQPDSAIPLPLAEAFVSALGLRELLRIPVQYPRAILAADAAEMRGTLQRHLQAALADGFFDDVRSSLVERGLDSASTEDSLTLLTAVLLILVPGALPADPHPDAVTAAMRKAHTACQHRVGPPLKQLAEQLVETKLYDCRMPEGDPVFSDPRRSLQLLRAYWGVCRSVVLHHTDAPLGLHPHPLQRILVSCRARIYGHLARLEDGENSRRAKDAVGVLLETVLGGDPDDLSAVPEWTRGQVAVVEGFLEDARLRAGSRVFPLTVEEDLFLTHAESEVARYCRHIADRWTRTLASMDAKRAPGASVATVPTATGVPPTAPHERGVGPAVPADPVARPQTPSAPLPPATAGQPCLGLTSPAIEVVRAYQTWEARREKRGGLPVTPTVDDLVAETNLARATVINARKVLVGEGLLEQVPGARPGSLRLAQRGLQLQIPASAPTV